MPGSLKQVYWDSCVFLAYLIGEEGRVDVLETLLRDASNKREIQILTSTLSIVEVATAASDEGPMPEEEIDALWRRDPGIELVELSQLIARDARSLIRQAKELNRSLRPPDSIHLATARRIGAEEFHTYDAGLLRTATALGFTCSEPYVASQRLPGL